MPVERPIVLSKEQQAQTIANYLPSGRVFSAKNLPDTVLRKLLLGFANELLRVDSLIAIFREDTVPDQTEFFIPEWERALGIPDDCFDGKGDDDSRRLSIITKLASLGIQTDPDFVALAAKFGVTVTVEGGSIHGLFPFKFPIKFYASPRDARFTLVVRPSPGAGDSFTYTFPIKFGSSGLSIVECLFNKVKPANVNVVFE